MPAQYDDGGCSGGPLERQPWSVHQYSTKQLRPGEAGAALFQRGRRVGERRTSGAAQRLQQQETPPQGYPGGAPDHRPTDSRYAVSQMHAAPGVPQSRYGILSRLGWRTAALWTCNRLHRAWEWNLFFVPELGGRLPREPELGAVSAFNRVSTFL